MSAMSELDEQIQAAMEAKMRLINGGKDRGVERFGDLLSVVTRATEAGTLGFFFVARKDAADFQPGQVVRSREGYERTVIAIFP